MPSAKPQQLAIVRRTIQEGATWRAAAAAAGLPLSTAYEHATSRWPELRGRGPAPVASAERRQLVAAIIAGRHSFRAIARQSNRSPNTICRLAAQLIEQQLQAEGLEPIRATRPHRCPSCGRRITTADCIACQAARN